MQIYPNLSIRPINYQHLCQKVGPSVHKIQKISFLQAILGITIIPQNSIGEGYRGAFKFDLLRSLKLNLHVYTSPMHREMRLNNLALSTLSEWSVRTIWSKGEPFI